MADLVIDNDDVRVVVRGNEHQHTAPAGEAIAAGQYIRWSTAGKFELGNATAAGEVGDGFIAEKDAAVGEPVTGVKGPTVSSHKHQAVFCRPATVRGMPTNPGNASTRASQARMLA